MSFILRRYEERDAEAWDELVAASWNGTFLHKRRFLAYHGKQFRDLSLVVEDGRGQLVGVFPAALDPERKDLVTSHPGLTYGGVVHNGALRGPAMLETLRAIVCAYREMGLSYMRYKTVPYIYQEVPASDDLYALFRLGAVRYRCDLSAAIDLTSHWKPNDLRRRDLKKAQRSGVRIAIGSEYLEPFWTVLEENLALKYDTRPVHALEEITYLQERFPEKIQCAVGTIDGAVVAGIVLFRTSRVAHVQYSASNEHGNKTGAQTAVIDYAIEKSAKAGMCYFDFGVSNEQDGKVLNEGLYRFKTSFGAGGVVHEFYELELSSRDA